MENDKLHGINAEYKLRINRRKENEMINIQFIAHSYEYKYLVSTSKNITLVLIFKNLFDTCIFQSIYVSSKKFNLIASMLQYARIYDLLECFLLQQYCFTF